MPDPTVKIITRESPLAMWQANFVKQCLMRSFPDLTVDIKGITTEADKFLDKSLDKFGGKGVFTKDLETALLNGSADIAVHSMKDVTVNLPEGLEICSILKRERPGDAFVSNKHDHINNLPEGSIIGTSSLRRISQLKAFRSDLKIKPIRGNVGTRLTKLDHGEFDALILATAGLERLQLGSRIKHELDFDVMLPAIGQGALGLEVCSDNSGVINILKTLNDPDSHTCVMTERRVNKALNGGCHAPIAGHAVKYEEGIQISAMVGSVDGSRIIRATLSGPVNKALELGDEMGSVLIDKGAQDLLSADHIL